MIVAVQQSQPSISIDTRASVSIESQGGVLVIQMAGGLPGPQGPAGTGNGSFPSPPDQTGTWAPIFVAGVLQWFEVVLIAGGGVTGQDGSAAAVGTELSGQTGAASATGTGATTATGSAATSEAGAAASTGTGTTTAVGSEGSAEAGTATPFVLNPGSAAATGTQASAETGTATATGSGTTAATGAQATSEAGTATASVVQNGSAAATGVEGTGEAGTASAAGSGVAAAAGSGATAETGTASATGMGISAATGAQGTSEAGTASASGVAGGTASAIGSGGTNYDTGTSGWAITHYSYFPTDPVVGGNPLPCEFATSDTYDFAWLKLTKTLNVVAGTVGYNIAQSIEGVCYIKIGGTQTTITADGTDRSFENSVSGSVVVEVYVTDLNELDGAYMIINSVSIPVAS